MEKNVVGIDISKSKVCAVRLMPDGRRERREFGTGERGQAALLSWLGADTVALEAGNQAFRIARTIRAATACTVIVLNPGDLATIYASLKKTDKEDALKLARLVQRFDRAELPEVTVPDESEEDIRRLCGVQRTGRHALFPKKRNRSQTPVLQCPRS